MNKNFETIDTVREGERELYFNEVEANASVLQQIEKEGREDRTKDAHSLQVPHSNVGITLIALIITIIVLLILAGVTLNMVIGENGIVKKAQVAKQNTNQADAKESLQLMLLDVKASVNSEEKRNPIVTDFERLEGKDNIEGIYYENSNAIINYKGYAFTVNDKLEIIDQKLIEDNNFEPNSIIEAVKKINNNGINEININDELYSLDVIVNSGDLILDGTSQVDGATLNNKVYEFGDSTKDCATSSTDSAKNMVVLKVKGNLTISENVTLTSCKNDKGYGGPKGMLVYCTGTITNNGKISMTARGAIAEGQNVYLWKNSDESYEYVPKEGALGGEAQISTGTMTAGKPGKNGENRRTGGGGSGAAKRFSGGSGSRVSGAGTNGTSYSGGSAGGAICVRYDAQGQKGVENGGAGGKGISAYSSNYGAGGGAGNPGGYGMKSESTYSNSTFAGANGTGGLLIIYGETINNNNIIEANGSNGRTRFVRW